MNDQILYNRPLFPATLDMAHPLTKDLVGCWLFNETSGVRAFDSSPYENHAILTGFTNPIKRSFNGQLTNSSTYFLVDADNGSLNFTSQNFSIGVWVKHLQLSINILYFMRGLDSTDGYYFNFNAANSIRFHTDQAAADQTTLSANNVINDTKDFHCAMGIRNRAVVDLYLDGIKLVPTTSASHLNPLTSTRQAKIGAYDDGTSNLVSHLAMVCVWRRNLTGDEPRRFFQEPYNMFLER